MDIEAYNRQWTGGRFGHPGGAGAPYPCLLAVTGVDADRALRLLFTARGGSLTGYLLAPRTDIAKLQEDDRLFHRELLLGEVAHLQHHLQFDEPLLPWLIVQKLFISHRLDLSHDPVEAGHGQLKRKQQNVIEKEHAVCRRFASSLRALQFQADVHEVVRRPGTGI